MISNIVKYWHAKKINVTALTNGRSGERLIDYSTVKSYLLFVANQDTLYFDAKKSTTLAFRSFLIHSSFKLIIRCHVPTTHSSAQKI